MKRRDFVAGTCVAAGAWAARASALMMPVEEDRPPALPALYVAHGGPNLAASEERARPLREWGARLDAPRAYLGITPHTRAAGVQLTAIGVGRALMSFPRRFLPDADRFAYASPDSSSIADEVSEALRRTHVVGRGGDGINHTIWQVLMHLRPQADVPVLQLALPFDMSDRDLFRLGRSLAPLRRRGVMVVASGNLTHNLAELGRSRPAWAERFDAWVAQRLDARDVDALVDWRRAAPDASLAHPDDGGHFDVLLVALGAASNESATFPVTGFEGSLSNRCIQLG